MMLEKKEETLAPEEEKEETQVHYEQAVQEADLAQVLVQPKDAARILRTAAAKMDAAGDYADAKKLAAQYRKEAAHIEEQGLEELYQRGLKTMSQAKNTAHRKLAASLFEEAGAYKDAEELARECLKENQNVIRKKNFRSVVTLCAVLLALMAGMLYWKNSPMSAYLQAEEMMALEDYETAAEYYEKAGDYKDSAKKLALCQEKAKEKK